VSLKRVPILCTDKRVTINFWSEPEPAVQKRPDPTNVLLYLKFNNNFAFYHISKMVRTIIDVLSLIYRYWFKKLKVLNSTVPRHGSSYKNQF
jgi:hypothetical protein